MALIGAAISSQRSKSSAIAALPLNERVVRSGAHDPNLMRRIEEPVEFDHLHGGALVVRLTQSECLAHGTVRAINETRRQDDMGWQQPPAIDLLASSRSLYRAQDLPRNLCGHFLRREIPGARHLSILGPALPHQDGGVGFAHDGLRTVTARDNVVTSVLGATPPVTSICKLSVVSPGVRAAYFVPGLNVTAYKPDDALALSMVSCLTRPLAEVSTTLTLAATGSPFASRTSNLKLVSSNAPDVPDGPISTGLRLNIVI